MGLALWVAVSSVRLRRPRVTGVGVHDWRFYRIASVATFRRTVCVFAVELGYRRFVFDVKESWFDEQGSS